MSWSLQIKNGDFALSGSSLGVVTNFDKLVQDLTCAIMERMGHDPLHPWYGSLIDGGVTPQGLDSPSLIGMDPQYVVNQVQSEIMRITGNLQSQQLSRAQADQSTYSRSTITPGEALIGVADIQFEQQQDTLLVTVSLTTALGDTTALTIPLSTNS